MAVVCGHCVRALCRKREEDAQETLEPRIKCKVDSTKGNGQGNAKKSAHLKSARQHES